ncbi:DnaJ domain-containing protein, partial [Pseudomassariella vexata]
TTHYEALKLTPEASAADIKKSFYNLSKHHHPDHNRSDPTASKRFMRISEAYSTLSSPNKRSNYDRDVLGLHSSSHGRRGGSYSSTTTSNPAGGRPASGLSKRRSTFTGPPPSFYRSGGWGAHSAKRRAAHEETTGGGGTYSARAEKDPNTRSWSTYGGMGPGQDPFGHHDEVPHFDRESHERTGHRTEQMRAARRTYSNESLYKPDRGIAGMFFVIGGVLMLSFLGPLAVS